MMNAKRLSKTMITALIAVLLLASSTVRAQTFDKNYFYLPGDDKTNTCTTAGSRYRNIALDSCEATCDDFVVMGSFADVGEAELFCVSDCRVYTWIYQIIEGKFVRACLPQINSSTASPLCNVQARNNFPFESNIGSGSGTEKLIASYGCTDLSGGAVVVFGGQFGTFVVSNITDLGNAFTQIHSTSASAFTIYVPKAQAIPQYASVQKADGTDEDFLATYDYWDGKKVLIDTGKIIASCPTATHYDFMDVYCILHADCVGNFAAVGTSCEEIAGNSNFTVYDRASGTTSDTDSLKIGNIGITAAECFSRNTTSTTYEISGNDCTACTNPEYYLGGEGIQVCRVDGTNEGNFADYFRKESTDNLHVPVADVEVDEAKCDTDRVEYCEYKTKCLKKEDIVGKTSLTNIFKMIIKHSQRSECHIGANTGLTFEGDDNVRISEADCLNRYGFVRVKNAGTFGECVRESACATVFLDHNGLKFCLSPFNTASDCSTESSFLYEGKCYADCPSGTFADSGDNTCKPYSACSQNILVRMNRSAICTDTITSNYKLFEDLIPTGSSSTQIYLTPGAVDAFGLYYMDLTPPSQADKIALWPDHCPKERGGEYLAVDHATKTCKEISTFASGAGCINKENGYYVHDPAGTRGTDTILCTGVKDDINFRLQHGILVLDNECDSATTEFAAPGKRCSQIDVVTEENPCSDESFRLFIDFDGAKAITQMRCLQRSGCDTTYPYQIGRLCLGINDPTNTNLAGITTAYGLTTSNLALYPADAAVAAPFIRVKECKTTGGQEAIEGSTDVCVSYSKCLAIGKQFVLDPTNGVYTCLTATSDHVQLVTPGMTQYYIFKDLCQSFGTDYYLRTLSWKSDLIVCKKFASGELKVASDVNAGTPVVSGVDTEFDNTILKEPKLIKLSGTTYRIPDSSIGDYIFVRSTGFYAETCPADTFIHNYNTKDECFTKEECVLDSKYHKYDNECVAFANIDTNGGNLDFDLGYVVAGLDSASCGDRLSLNKDTNFKGCISRVKCLNEGWNIDGNACVETCPDLTYTLMNYRECFTEEECRQNVYGDKDKQRLVMSTGNKCVTVSQCNADQFYSDLWNLTCVQTCVGLVNNTEGAFRTCISKCPNDAEGRVQYKQITAGEEGTCDITCDGDQFRTISKRSCDITCPADTFEYTPDKECTTNLECRNKGETHCAFYGGKCDIFTRGAGKYMSSDFICGNESDCMTGKLFDGNFDFGYPVIRYNSYSDSTKAFNLGCIKKDALVDDKCPEDTYPNQSGTFDKCMSEFAAQDDDLYLNYAETHMIDGCGSTDTIVRVEDFNRCVPTAEFITGFIDKLDISYYRFVDTNGVSRATKECDKENSVGYYRGTEDFVCKNETQCDDDPDYLYFSTIDGATKACIHKTECVDDKIVKVVKKGDKEVRQCITTSECLEDGGHFLYRPEERLCSKLEDCEFEFFLESKCFTRDTCHAHNEYIFTDDDVHCYSRTQCDAIPGPGGIIGRTLVGTAYQYRNCYTLDQCKEADLYINNESRYCIPRSECDSLCRPTDSGCNVKIDKGYCFKTFPAQFTSDPELMYEYNHDVSSESCASPLKFNFQAKECQESCSKFINSSGNVCYDECLYSLLPDNFELTRPYTCTEFQVRPLEYKLINIGQYNQLNNDTYLLTKLIPPGFKEQFGLLVACPKENLLIEQVCQSLVTCPEFTFPVYTDTTNTEIAYCRTCKEDNFKAWFPLLNTDGVRVPQCVTSIPEPAFRVSIKYNGYKPCSEVDNAFIEDGKCVASCSEGRVAQNGVCQAVPAGNAVLDGVVVKADSCEKNDKVYYNGLYVNKLDCRADQSQIGGRCAECAEDERKFLYQGKCSFSCPVGLCGRDGDCVSCSEFVEGFDFSEGRFVSEGECASGCQDCRKLSTGRSVCVCERNTGSKCQKETTSANSSVYSALTSIDASLNSISLQDPCAPALSYSSLNSILTNVNTVVDNIADDSTEIFDNNLDLIRTVVEKASNLLEATLKEGEVNSELQNLSNILSDCLVDAREKLTLTSELKFSIDSSKSYLRP